MTNVVMTGSFDGVHEGHLHIMQLAKQLGEFLYVCVVADSTIEKNKGRPPKYSQEIRIRKVEDTLLPSYVIKLTGDDEEDISTILKIPPHIYCFGHDQQHQHPLWNHTLEEKLRQAHGENVSFCTLEPYQRERFGSTQMQQRGELLMPESSLSFYDYLTRIFEL